MKKTVQKISLHIFRRDLRLEDNSALIAALKSSKQVIPCFIFDPRQIKGHDYRSDPGLSFLLDSIEDLNKALKSCLHICYGRPDQVVEALIKDHGVEAVYVNEDYTPFSRHRDALLEKVCRKNNVPFYAFADCLLHKPGAVLKADGTPYTIYTPFKRRALEREVARPQRNSLDHYKKLKPHAEGQRVYKELCKKFMQSSIQKGGRSEALQIIKCIKNYKNYKDVRDIPSIEGTTRLASHHKFGTCSIREVFHAIAVQFGIEHTLITELLWRDFFTHIGFHFPHVFTESFREKYRSIAWANDKKEFQIWCEGRTGFPIVDAGMRELNATGFMHNRVRMVTASFLVKDLHIDWRWGEKYFARKLTDYDPAVNNGNWQWAASTGCDAQPYFRIFNPWRQQQRFDPDCIYIKKWIPELKDLAAKDIHKLETKASLFQLDYPKVIVDHKQASQKAKQLFKEV